jgi:hypothetical protein
MIRTGARAVCDHDADVITRTCQLLKWRRAHGVLQRLTDAGLHVCQWRNFGVLGYHRLLETRWQAETQFTLAVGHRVLSPRHRTLLW